MPLIKTNHIRLRSLSHNWKAEAKPEIIATETTIFSDIHGYAGTVDCICRIDGVPYVIDFKTSKQVWHEYELQISAYRVALENGENSLKRMTSTFLGLSGITM
jgi:ATP-dependent exoDNAse (exonuclease V) beta subunit